MILVNSFLKKTVCLQCSASSGPYDFQIELKLSYLKKIAELSLILTFANSWLRLLEKLST